LINSSDFARGGAFICVFSQEEARLFAFLIFFWYFCWMMPYRIPRLVAQDLKNKLLTGGKIVLLYGPRRVGKTTLARTLMDQLPGRTLSVNADLLDTHEVLSSRNLIQLKSLVAGYDNLFIDEAQRIKDIGINLKILHDEVPQLKILATGSSSFDLVQQAQEPLTGRVWTCTLYPVAISELVMQLNSFEVNSMRELLLVYGSYPEIFYLDNSHAKKEYLKELTHSYLFKDIFATGRIKLPQKLRDLLRLLAYQIGSEVSINELSNKLQMHRDVVLYLLEMLEKTFVIFRLNAFRKNFRKEVSRHGKIYFYDLGVRNALIDNFKPLDKRDDVGQLWENFLIIERMKSRSYARTQAPSFFWRLQTGAELDFVEDTQGEVHGYEFKYGKKIVKPPASWNSYYPSATFQTINTDNYIDFLLEPVKPGHL
jgi:predicted AAA+ superfamily ATPase